jgi:UDP-glucose 4-epimerase
VGGYIGAQGQGFIAPAIASAMRGVPIQIFGQRGTVRDYLYVSDLAAGIVSALVHGNLYETYNFGSGIGLSNLDVVDAMIPLMREIGCGVRVENHPERAFDVKASVLDTTKLKSDTGWTLKVGFLEGFITTRDWLKGQLL